MLNSKWCNKGEHYVPFDGFSKSKSSPDGLDYFCKSCRKTLRQGRIEQERLYHKKYRERNKELRRKYNEHWRTNNKDYFQSWCILNKDKNRDYAKKYASKKRSGTPFWLSDEQHQQILNFYSHARDCEVVSGEKYHVDHIIPLQGETVCGLHVPWNLQVLPADVNISKSNKVASND